MIIINFPSLDVSERENITGEIYFSFDGFDFPEKSWNDSVIRVLDMWADEIIQLWNNFNNDGSFYFMDGPLKMKATQYKDLNDKFLHLTFFYKNRNVAVKDINLFDFTINFVKTVNEVIEYLSAKNVIHSSITLLSTKTIAIQKQVE